MQHWQDPEERKDRRFFFCQLEAIETLIWLTEAPESDRTGIEIPSDGGDFSRWCSKMATGSGKTIVMSQLIAWQVLNKIANGKGTRFSKNVLVVAPGLTVRNRLSVLNPSDKQNYYEEFNIVPQGLMETLRQGKIKIINWHTLAWDTQKKLDEKIAKGNLRTVDRRKKTEISDEAYVKDVLGDMASATNIIVINDEAHHAWRVNPDFKGKKDDKELVAEATIWVGGLDKIHRSRGILQCFDLSATPFAPSGKQASEEALFPWIVSDFGLNDAIESGLVKTPRVVIRDDGSPSARDFRSKLYHIYTADVEGAKISDDLNQKVDDTIPLPDLAIVHLLNRTSPHANVQALTVTQRFFHCNISEFDIIISRVCSFSFQPYLLYLCAGPKEIVGYLNKFLEKNKSMQEIINEQITTFIHYKKSLIHEVVIDKKQVYSLEKKNKMANKNLQIRNSTAEFLIFTSQAGENGIEVRFQNETIWLSQKMMAVLFDCSADNISLHLKNIFKTKELNENSVAEDLSVTASDGKNYKTKHYNLDAIITNYISLFTDIQQPK